MWCHVAFKEEKHPAWQISPALDCARANVFVAIVCSQKTELRYRDAFMCCRTCCQYCLMLFSSCRWAVTEEMSREKADRCNTIQTGAHHTVSLQEFSAVVLKSKFVLSAKNIKVQKLLKCRNFSIYDSKQPPSPCFKVKLMPWTFETLCKINGGVSDMLRNCDTVIEVAHLFSLLSHPSASLFMEMYSYFPHHILLTHR